MKNLIIVFTCLCTIVHAQPTFNHQYNLNYNYKLLTSVLPTDSCYYVTGLITDTADQSYRLGLLFLKLDLEGEIEIENKTVSDDVWFQPWRGDLLDNGDGSFYKIADKTDSVYSVSLLKINTIGDTLFTRTYLNPMFPEEDFIVIAAAKQKIDGEMYLLCGVDSDPNGVDPDIFLIKVTVDGQVIGSYKYGQSVVREIPYSLLIDSDGGAIIGANKTNESSLGNNFYSRTYIFKVNKSGQVQWEYHTPNSDLFDIAMDMIRTPDGGIVVATGKGIEHVINSQISELRWNSYLLKLNANHQKEWGVELRGTRHSAGTGFKKVVESVDGYGYVAMGNLGEDVSIGEEVYGSWVAKVSPEGDSLWARYYSFFDSIKTEPRPYDLKTTPDGGYVIVGETRPDLPTGFAQRAWIMKLDRHGCLIPDCHGGDTVVVATKQPMGSPVKLAIYPNPTSDFLNFQLRSAMPIHEARFRVVDINGRVVKELESRMPKETHIVPVQGWPAGVYFLQYVVDGLVRHSERFVVLKQKG